MQKSPLVIGIWWLDVVFAKANTFTCWVNDLGPLFIVIEHTLVLQAMLLFVQSLWRLLYVRQWPFSSYLGNHFFNFKQ